MGGRDETGRWRRSPATAEESADDDGAIDDDGVASRLAFGRLHEVARFASKAHASRLAYGSVTYEAMYGRIRSIASALVMDLGLRSRDRVRRARRALKPPPDSFACSDDGATARGSAFCVSTSRWAS